MTTTEKSPYRRLEEAFADRPDEFWENLEEYRHAHPTICVGWAIERARRYLNLDQVQIAARTEVRDATGHVVEPGFSKSYISALLSLRSTASPLGYLRIARACEVNVIEFYIAEGWLPQEYIAAWKTPEGELAMPILREIGKLPASAQPSARAVVLSVLQSIQAAIEAQTPADQPKPPPVPLTASPRPRRFGRR